MRSTDSTPIWAPQLPPLMVKKAGALQLPLGNLQVATPRPCFAARLLSIPERPRRISPLSKLRRGSLCPEYSGSDLRPLCCFAVARRHPSSSDRRETSRPRLKQGVRILKSWLSSKVPFLVSASQVRQTEHAVLCIPYFYHPARRTRIHGLPDSTQELIGYGEFRHDGARCQSGFGRARSLCKHCGCGRIVPIGG
jgi:hypothetical protein